MSVNFYAFGPFPCGDASGEGLHIGQYTAVSRFLLRSHPDQGLTSLAAWMDFLRQPGVTSRAEHDVQMSANEMEETIRERTDRSGRPKSSRFPRITAPAGCHRDAEGFEFRDGEFF